jgi:hypothetical protein
LTAETLASANSFTTPDAVTIRQSRIKTGRDFEIDLPKHSVAVLSMEVLGNGR